MLLELREAMMAMARAGTPQVGGVRFQESRLPPVDGPGDCFSCHAVEGYFVPVRYQRIFEDGLRSTGMPPMTVWQMREYRPPDALIGKGRGWVSLSRGQHSDHLEEYREWKAGRYNRSG